MKKFSLCIVLFILLLAGCSNKQKDEYTYLQFGDREFIKESEGVYNNENDYIYYTKANNGTLITMSFTEVKIEMYNGDPKIIFPDGCYQYAKNSDGFLTFYGPGNPHNHDFSVYGSLMYEKVAKLNEDNSEEFIFPLVFSIIVCIISAAFVFKPSNVEKYIKFINKFWNKYKNTAEPSDFYISLGYIISLVCFIGSIVFIIYLLKI